MRLKAIITFVSSMIDRRRRPHATILNLCYLNLIVLWEVLWLDKIIYKLPSEEFFHHSAVNHFFFMRPRRSWSRYLIWKKTPLS